MATALVTQIAYAVQTLFDPAGTAGRLVDLGKLANYGLLTSFTPAYLFTTGVNGTWYDPSDITTLYSDSAGTQPVTDVEQPVGLMLDKSKGLVLGPELVINGDFATNTAWTKAAGVTISGGKANFASVNAQDALYQNVGAVAGKLYKITASITGTGTVSPVFGGNIEDPNTRRGAGEAVWLLNANTGANGNFIFYAQSFTGTIDNISVRELPGNHAFNSSGNSANFPVLSARYNLLTKTEDFSDAVWTKQAGTTVSSTKVAAPDGTLTAFSVTGNGTSGIHQAITGTLSLGQSVRSVYLRVPTGTATVGIKDPVLTQGTTTCNLTTSWQRFTLTETTPPSGGFVAGIWIFNIPASGIEVAWPDTRSVNDALNQPAYQRVNTSTDYDTVGFKPYLRFNGTNQWLQTNSIDFTYGDKMFVSAGVRKLSDAGIGAVVELSKTLDSNNGSFGVFTPNGGPNGFSIYARGTVTSGSLGVTTIPAPSTKVFSGLIDLPAPLVRGRLNGIQEFNITSTLGTGNFGNYPLYIGARAGSSLWFNGNLHQLVIAGKQASDAEITATETFINQKTGAY